MKAVNRCPHCDAKMVEYRHSLSKNIVSCLWVFLRRGGVIEFSKINDEMTFNQKNNFQKLQYWGLIQKVRDDSGVRLGGFWALTSLGADFLKGHVNLAKSVWTYRNRRVRYDGDMVSISDLGWEPYRRQADYVADERPRYVTDGGQLEFF